MKCHIPIDELRRLQTKAAREEAVLTTPIEALEAAAAEGLEAGIDPSAGTGTDPPT